MNIDDQDIKIQPQLRDGWYTGHRASIPPAAATHAVRRRSDGAVMAMCFSEQTTRLIAAAPDLLAACKAALEELEIYRCDVSEMEAPENVDALDQTITEVKAAIAKAKCGVA